MEVRIVNSRDVAACPKHSLSPAHYRDNGSCRCDENLDAQAAVDAAKADVAEAKQALADADRWLRST